MVNPSSAPDTSSADDARRIPTSVASSATVDEADDGSRTMRRGLVFFFLILLNFQNLYISNSLHFSHFIFLTSLSSNSLHFQAKWIPEIIRIVRCSVVHDGRVQNPTNTGHSTPTPSTIPTFPPTHTGCPIWNRLHTAPPPPPLLGPPPRRSGPRHEPRSCLQRRYVKSSPREGRTTPTPNPSS